MPPHFSPLVLPHLPSLPVPSFKTLFFSSEFQNLKFLRVLDLSHNGLTGIAENLIKGCEGLKVQKLCMTRLLLPAGNG